MNKQPKKNVNMKLIYLLFLGVFLLSACRNDDEVITHSVTFESNGGSAIASAEVQTGRRITEPAEPTKDDGSEFTGWYKEESLNNLWNFDVDIVTEDLTLYAGWVRVEPFPTEIGMTDEAFSNTLRWTQSNVSETTDFKLTFYSGTPAIDPYGNPIYQYQETGVVVDGTHTIVGENHIEWSPDEIIQGGIYKVVITTDGSDPQEGLGLLFKGQGSQNNPYLLFESSDIHNIANHDNVGLGNYYRLQANIDHESAYANIENNAFHGTLNGNGFEVFITGNAGMFFELGEEAVIENFVLRGTLLTGTTPLIGGIAHENYGVIRDTVSWVAITTETGEVGNIDTMLEGGAGGLVGINHEDALIEDCMFRSDGSTIGVIKAKIGAGGVASINYGTISRCENRGALGAFNAVESGRSLSRYSYMGGIAGFNYGLIEQSNTTSVGKLLAQRYWNVEPPEGTVNNRVIGGVVGYNGADGVIRESYFNGIRVHGDQYVGGIAGINAGLITHSYAGARYYSALSGRSYVGGRVNVGGIAGALEGDGRIEYSYAAINVYAYEDQPYAIAEEAFNSVYIEVNHDPRAIGSIEYGNVDTDQLVAPLGDNNTAVENSPLVSGDGVFYELPGNYTEILGSPFINENNHTILAWEIE